MKRLIGHLFSLVCLLLATGCLPSTPAPVPTAVSTVASTPSPLPASPTPQPESSATPQPTPTEPPLVPMDQFIKGVAYAGFGPGDYSTATSDWNLEHLVKPLGVNWIRIHTGTCRQETYRTPQITCQEAWGSNEGDLIHVTRRAHQLGLRVMLENYPPEFTNDPEHWAGDIGKGFSTDEQWAEWFQGYGEHLLKLAKLAEANQIDLLGIGQEISATTGREKEWRALIAEVRQVYHGPLIYSSDEEADWSRLAWWDAVDYIGIHPYNFAITSRRASNLEEMKAAWKPIVERLGKLSAKWQRPIVITEIGYPSQDGIGMNMNNWRQWWEVDVQESADLFQALIESFDGQPWFHGLFPYDLETQGSPAEPINLEMTFWAKPAYRVIQAYYGAAPLPEISQPVRPANLPQVLTIYDDRLGAKWSNYPPNGDPTAIQLAQTQTAVAGSAIQVTVPAWTELIFNYETSLNLEPYQWLEFDLLEKEAPASHPLAISFRDSNFRSLPFYLVLPYSQYVEGGELKAGKWAHLSIPLAAFGPVVSPVRTLVISAGSVGPITFFVDNVELKGK